jgi:hypothetical protein
MPGGRPAKKPRTAAASAARWHACGSGAAAAAAASEGGTAELDIEDALALADEVWCALGELSGHSLYTL